MQVAILGRQAKISLAELESLFGAENTTPISDYAALVQSEEPLPQSRLGGTIKSGAVKTRLKNADLEKAFEYINNTIVDAVEHLPEGKIQFGISVYGFKAQRDWLLRKNLSIKKLVRKSGRSIRIIENKSEVLEAAQVLYNKLTGPLGIELLIIKDGPHVIIARTTAVQDIDAYAARDHGRPKRDAFVGMLPPKLAQIMINIAVRDADPKHGAVILDPFCGTGVVLQEAAMMGFDIYGSDIDQRMIDYTTENLLWLQQAINSPITTHATDGKYFKADVGDATSHTWKPLPSFIVCETYLGKPLSSLPSPEKLAGIMNEANIVAEGFLKNVAAQLKSGARLCLALPAWHLGNGTFKHLLVLDHLEDLGYNRLDLVHAENKDLIYHRENQVVARELTILEKK